MYECCLALYVVLKDSFHYLEISSDRNRVIRDLLERQHVCVADLHADRPGLLDCLFVLFKYFYLRRGPRAVEFGVVPQNLIMRRGLAGHLSLIVSPKTAIWGEKLRNLPLNYDS